MNRSEAGWVAKPAKLLAKLRVPAAVAAALLLLAGFGRSDLVLWSKEERAVLATMSLARLPPPPADPSNAVADLAAAAVLGKQLFADTRLSGNGAVSCASCHAPEQQFQDGLQVGKGVGEGRRRTMPVAATAYSAWMFWDGRKDSQWSQALGPLEDAAEHGSNRVRIARLLQANHQHPYEVVFGALPSLDKLPQDASPLGTVAQRQAWERMSEKQRDEVNRVFANLGKAIAAYERTLSFGESRFDRYVKAVLDGGRAGQQEFSAQESNGLRLFVGKGQCAGCHNGPLLTDQAFHNTGVAQRDPVIPDRGRAAATAKVGADEFNCLGRNSDAPPQACQELQFIATDDAGMEGAFKTPSLRNVALRPPYMHAGQFATLEQAVAHYARSPAATVGHSELAADGHAHGKRKPIRLSEQEVQDLAAFLRTLTGPIVERPID